MTNDSTLGVSELSALVVDALSGNGVSTEDATEVARVLVLADLFGIRTHGIQRVAEYIDRARLGGITSGASIEVERVAPGLARVDGGNGIGPLIGMRALREASAMAREVGIGAVFVRNSNHFGPIMPYCFVAAQDGFASIIGSNATTTIAAWGGSEAKLGNSPFAIGVPRPDGDPVILDVAMSVVARAKIRNAAKAGAAIPDTWATDSTGKPTTDPVAALDGFLLPMGGHKGYGLALMIDMLAGVLSGASYLTRIESWSKDPEKPQNLGHFFVLIDTRALADSTWLAERVGDFVDILHSSTPLDPGQPVRVPGEFEMAEYHRQMRSGVSVDSKDLDALRALVR